jgi:hypothetical protein
LWLAATINLLQLPIELCNDFSIFFVFYPLGLWLPSSNLPDALQILPPVCFEPAAGGKVD